MGIYIHGMKLDGRPHKALFTERDGKFVMVVETQYSFSDKEIKVYPVEELPPHGRLGDLDKLVEKINGIWDCNDMVFKPDDHCCNVPEDCKGCKWAQTRDCIQRMVENAPTIIPAEEGDGDE